MSGFPKLVPAFTAKIPLASTADIGSARHGGMFHAGFVPESGSLASEPGYGVDLDAVFVHGSDYLRVDPGGRHARLDVASLTRDAKSGAFLRFTYTGTVDLTGPAGLVLGGKPDAATTEFGDIFTHVTFESSGSTLQALNYKTFVGAGRFIVEKDKPVVVEYKISEVTL